MGKIIACVHEKGGVGKSTTVKHLSVGLFRKGKKVLIIDLDPSGNLTLSLGMGSMDPNERGAICEIIEKIIEFEDVPEGFGIKKHEEGIDIITSSYHLHSVVDKMQSSYQRELILKRYITGIKELYDYILIDSPGGLGLLSVNALFCADELIIPLQPHMTSVQAIQNLFICISNVRKMRGTKKPGILGMLFVMARTNTNNDNVIMKDLRAAYEGKIPFFKTFIPLATKIPESDKKMQSIFKYAENSAAAMIYQDLVDEILEAEEVVEQ